MSLQTHAQAVKTKRSCVVTGGQEHLFDYRVTFKLRPQSLDESCLKFELQQPKDNSSGWFIYLQLSGINKLKGFKDELRSVVLQKSSQLVYLLLTESPSLLGVLVLGPFMYARGPQLQHWMDMVNEAQEPVKLWHGLSRAT